MTWLDPRQASSAVLVAAAASEQTCMVNLHGSYREATLLYWARRATRAKVRLHGVRSSCHLSLPKADVLAVREPPALGCLCGCGRTYPRTDDGARAYLADHEEGE